MLVIEDVMSSQATRMDGWMDGYVSVVDVSPIFGWIMLMETRRILQPTSSLGHGAGAKRKKPRFVR